MRTLLAIAALCTSALAAPVPTEVKKEAAFEGVWRIESMVVYGKARPIDGNEHWTIDAEGNVIHHSRPVPKPVEMDQKNIRLVIDAKAKTLEYVVRGDIVERTAIYELTGDTLKICCNFRGGKRPDKFEKGDELVLWTFKRVQPKGKE